MWICPKCGATNFNVGACECCGYGGNHVKITDDTGTGDPLPKAPETIC